MAVDPLSPTAAAGPSRPGDADEGLPARLLRWGEENRRDLPWRRTRDPWLVLLSEVMLQQTQVSRVVERYRDFRARYPAPAVMASAPRSEVLRGWQGLGYPRRARDLHAAAGIIVDRHEGSVPSGLDDLLALPGVGPYTARAVQAFAFELRVGVLDTNVGRVLARWSGTPLAPADAQRRADELVPAGRAWSWNQAVLDFGSEVCTKRAPGCGRCVLRDACGWAGAGPDPAVGSAAVSRRQARFEGSLRQARGRLLARLGEGPCPVGEVDEVVARSLAADGLITARGGCWRLAD